MTKENLDTNLNAEKKLANIYFYPDEKETNRVFGKDLKNSNNNSISVKGSSSLINLKDDNKKNVKFISKIRKLKKMLLLNFITYYQLLKKK
jgi:hypothetical protein